MTCSTCGREERAEANFCSNCGRVLAWRVNPAAVPPVNYATRLQRPREGRMIAGVCAGLAEHYGWDASLVRIILVLSILLGAGAPLIAYLAAWIVIPNAPFLLPAYAYPAYSAAGPTGAAGTMGQ